MYLQKGMMSYCLLELADRVRISALCAFQTKILEGPKQLWAGKLSMQSIKTRFLNPGVRDLTSSFNVSCRLEKESKIWETFIR